MKPFLMIFFLWVCQLGLTRAHAQSRYPEGYIPVPYEDTITITGVSTNSVRGTRTNRIIFAVDLKHESVAIGDTLAITVTPLNVKEVGIITKLCYEDCYYRISPTAGRLTNGYSIDTVSSINLRNNTYLVPITEQSLFYNEAGNQLVLDNSTLSTIYIYLTNQYKYDAVSTLKVSLKKKVENRQALPFARERVKPNLKNARYHALLIGVNNYDDANLRLKRPAVDIARLDSVLTSRYAFSSITTLIDPTKKTLKDVMTHLAYRLVNDDNLVIYYAGHADENSGNGYWALRDSKVGDYDSFLSVAALTNMISQMRTQQVLLVADACYGSTIIRSLDMAPEGRLKTWQELYNQQTRRAISSSDLEKVPDKSTFLEYFIKALRNNEDFLSGEQLFDSFKYQVYNKSSTRQRPIYGNIDGVQKGNGDFIFKVKTPVDSGIVLERTLFLRDSLAQGLNVAGLDSVQVVHLDRSNGDTTRAGIENYSGRGVTLINTYKRNVTVQVALKDKPANPQTIPIPIRQTKILDLGNSPVAKVTIRTDDNQNIEYQVQRGMRYQILWLAESGQLDLYMVR